MLIDKKHIVNFILNITDKKKYIKYFKYVFNSSEVNAQHCFLEKIVTKITR